MSFDVGRIRHLAEQMHRSEDDAGDPIADGFLLAAAGDTGMKWVDPATIGGSMWFNVTSYGAVGDGSTDDRAAINLAIAAYNAAGGGVLYFPAVPSGDFYYVSDALAALTMPGTILGDGDGYSAGGAASPIATDHTTANLFTLSENDIRVTGLRLVNFSNAETAGAAIAVTTANGSHNRYDHLTIDGFRDGMSLIYGFEWSMSDCYITNPVRYGVNISNIDLPDGGDWSMSNVWFGTRTRNATDAIHITSAGGGKIVNCKINANHIADQGGGVGIKKYVDGINLSIGAGIITVLLQVSNTSIENVSGDGIDISTVSTGQFAFVNIDGCQVGLYSNNTGRAVKATAASTGGLGTNGGLSDIVIDGLVAYTSGTARAAIELTNTNNVVLGEIALNGFNARYTGSGDTNTTDGGSSSPTGAAGGDLSGTYPNPSVVDDSHSHTASTAPGPLGHYEVVVSGTAPPVAVTNVAEDDWVYGFMPD